MAKIIAIDRKYLTTILGTAFLALLCISAVGLWKSSAVNANKVLNPEVKMLGAAIDPAAITKDMTYGSLTLKNVQVIPSKTFDLTVNIQNVTDRPMKNLALELEISLLGDSNQKNIIPAQLQSLDPGQPASVTFRGVKALGDAAGENAAVGQHLIVIRIKANPAGGLNKTSEASFKFLVDSTVKAANP